MISLTVQKWKILRKNKKSQIWTKKALFEYFRFKFEKANQKSTKTTTITATTKNGAKNALF